jgi:jumonji domain-containing protein 7
MTSHSLPSAAVPLPPYVADRIADLSDALNPPVIAELDCGDVGEVDRVAFLRDYVNTSTPVVLRGAAARWPARHLWDQAYLERRLGSAPLRVALTPNGLADAVTPVVPADVDPTTAGDEEGRIFIAPAEVQLTAADLFALLKRSEPVTPATAAPSAASTAGRGTQRLPVAVGGDAPAPPAVAAAALTNSDWIGRVPPGAVVAYAQAQQGCLDAEFRPLQPDLPDDIAEFGRAIFGAGADAANVWIGGARSVTSVHQDWYENLYVVLRGAKEFVLVPPWDCATMSKGTFVDATYAFDPAALPPTSSGAQPSPLSSPFSIMIRQNNEKAGGENGIKPDGGDNVNSSASPRHPSWAGPNPVETLWLDMDLGDARVVRQLQRDGAHIHRVTVSAGDVLYLPAMWYHYVGQRPDAAAADGGFVCAVNYWFDMQFGAGFQLQQLIKTLHRHADG